jgi:serine/threonine-protein kinase
VLEAFKREALILERLQGGVGPKLIDSQLVGETKFLIMEWIDGMQSHLWAARVTRLDPRERHSEMLCLCKEIVKAYAMLHGQGVLHSDIYSKNVLMCRDGSARLVDFGYSFHDEVDAIVGQSRRNCNPYFKSPDLARRDISDKKVAQPSPTVASEIYSIGALLYYLVTGSTYIDFSLQQSAIDVQICSSAMVPFAQRGIVGFDVLEGIIAKMLAKEPGDRYASLAECLSDLNNVTAEYSPVGLDVRQLSLDDAPTLKSLATVTIPPPLAAPSASVNYGGAGIALALLKAAHALDDASLIQAADLWAAYANVWMEAGPEGRLNEKMGITSQALGPYAILHSIEGIWLVQALVAHGQLDSVSLRGLCLKFLAGMHKREAPLEFIFGKAGMLNAILQLSFLVKDNEPLVRIGNELVADMMKEISSATNFEQSSVQVLGFAHGWAGILYPLLAWGRRYDAELVARVVPLLERLAAYKVDTRLGSFWPHRFDRPIDQGDMAGWCNGTAGFILLWGEAYLATGDSRWLSLARDAARHCMTYLENNNSVCCGLAGRGYALAILGAISGEEEWERAAQRCLQQEAAGTPDIALHPHSLFKGVLGHELARLEVLKREGIAFPMLASDMYGEPLPVGQLS